MSNIQLPLSKPSEIDDIKYDIKEVEAYIHKIGFEPQSPFDILFDALLSLVLKIILVWEHYRAHQTKIC